MASRSAIVTGGGGAGCGRAIALRFAAAGYAIAVADIDEQGGRETVRAVEEIGGRAVYCRTDVSSEDDVRRLFAFAEDLAPLGVLVNNASYHNFDESLSAWKRQVEVEMLGGLNTTWHAIAPMKRAGGGAIVNIGSISALAHGRKGGFPIYDAAKAGLMRITTGLRPLAQTDCIRVNCLAPGWIATHGPLEYWQSLTPQERVERGVPSRLLAPQEIAALVERIANDETLAGRVIMWWSEDSPRLIADSDRGYFDCAEY